MNDATQRNATESGACCAGPDPAGPARGGRSWRTVIFSIIIVAALAVTAYSFLTGDRVTATSADENSASATLASSGSAETLDAVQSASADHDVLLAFMPSGDERDAAAHEVMMATVGYLSTGGAKAGVLELERGSDEFADAASRYAPESYPAVLAVSHHGEVQTVSGEISKETLLKACVRACGKPTGCQSACSAKKKKGCDPAACGM